MRGLDRLKRSTRSTRWRLGWLLPMLLLALAASAQPRGRKPAKPAANVPSVPAVVSPEPVLPSDPLAVRQKLFQAASLESSFKDSEALAKYQEILKINANHYLALWQSAVLSVKIGARYSDETRKTAYFNAARQYADRALALRPEGGESNYAEALALFNQATLYRAGGRLRAFRDLRAHVFLATEHRPDLAQAWQLLGRWQFRVAHYNLFERAFSKVVLGDVPDGGSNKHAIASLEKAHELDPKNIQYCYDLARMYRYQGKRRKAIAVLREAAKLLPITSEELVMSRLCRQMLPPLLRADSRRQRRKSRQLQLNKLLLATPDSAQVDSTARKRMLTPVAH